MLSPIMQQALALSKQGVLKAGGQALTKTLNNGVIQVFRLPSGAFQKVVTKNGIKAVENFDCTCKHTGFEFTNAQGTIKSWFGSSGQYFDIAPLKLNSYYSALIGNEPPVTHAFSKRHQIIHCADEAKMLIKYMLGGKSAPKFEDIKVAFKYALN